MIRLPMLCFRTVSDLFSIFFFPHTCGNGHGAHGQAVRSLDHRSDRVACPRGFFIDCGVPRRSLRKRRIEPLPRPANTTVLMPQARDSFSAGLLLSAAAPTHALARAHAWQSYTLFAGAFLHLCMMLRANALPFRLRLGTANALLIFQPFLLCLQ